MTIREAKQEDYDAVWTIFQQVIDAEDSYMYTSNTSKEELENIWFHPTFQVYIIEDTHRILGSYILKANQRGLGSHIANASYMVHKDARGRGIGGLLCEHSIIAAQEFGYLALQFNAVVSTNLSAISLWKKHGFEIVGTIPKGFRHSSQGYVDIHIMHRTL